MNVGTLGVRPDAKPFGIQRGVDGCCSPLTECDAADGVAVLAGLECGCGVEETEFHLGRVEVTLAPFVRRVVRVRRQVEPDEE